jgi:hypothetical protein
MTGSRSTLIAWTAPARAAACAGLASGLLAGIATSACSSTSDTSTDAGASSGTDAASGDASPGNGSDAGAPGDDGGVPEGGAAVTPHTVACGAASCDTQRETCCALADGGGGCVAGSTATCPTGSAALHCTEAADCDPGSICCGNIDFQSGTPSTGCATTCSTFQFCGTSAECTNGEPCAVQSCFGRVVEMCGRQGFCK